MRISITKVLSGCVILGGTVYGVTMMRGAHASEKRRVIEQLEKENEELSREITTKQNYLSELEKNPDEMEFAIKQKLMLVNPGSKSFILQDGKKAEAGKK